MKKFLFCIIISGFISCKETTKLTSETLFFTEAELAICQKEPCATVTIEFPEFKGNKVVSEKMNAAIKNDILDALYLGEGSPDSELTISEAAATFVIASKDHKTAFDMALEYEASLSIVETFRNEEIICLEKASSNYTGGAHGMASTLFDTYELESGRLLLIEDLIADIDGFTKVAERAFKEQKGLSVASPIQESDYWFEEDGFYLPYTPGFTENGLLFVFQPYDIGPWSEGFISFEVSWELAKPFLSKNYFE